MLSNLASTTLWGALVLLGLLWTAGAGCYHQPGLSDASGEVEQLLIAFRESELVLERNGRRYNSLDATEWLARKTERTRPDSAESFIERVATRSGSGGPPYVLFDRDGAKIPAGDWFAARLAELRAR